MPRSPQLVCDDHRHALTAVLLFDDETEAHPPFQVHRSQPSPNEQSRL
jgi:hypothetical protein